MKVVTFWFDVISPYAWLAFDRLPQALEGQSHVVDFRPLLFAGLLKAWGQKGPAEIAPKRVWTYRQVAWLAHLQGTPLQLPRPHPFNPLALQRLALASAPAGGLPNRRVVEQIFRHVWCRDGADPNDPAALAVLAQAVAPVRDPLGEDVRAELRAATDAARAQGVFGVPTLACEGRLFWGQDALPMLRAAMQGDAWFDGPAWGDAARQPEGVVRHA
ncbi:2-hydroxychromene-2-carboxylate isomerase [Ideonella sp. A 288]|uniref:2-hydroxychromene-2-carboxylate isomerase n=1 Tax=Ideonella sp. A 288 TaxID=1962181 RepID=UPI000B4B0EE6|nr:2-hydroxychromene-2-carboxylate isomerase [Ideonella sp. A 288]